MPVPAAAETKARQPTARGRVLLTNITFGRRARPAGNTCSPFLPLPCRFHSHSPFSFHSLSKAKPSVDHKTPFSESCSRVPSWWHFLRQSPGKMRSSLSKSVDHIRSHSPTVSAVGCTLQLGHYPSIPNLGSTTNAARRKASYPTSLFSTSLASPATLSALVSSYTRPSYVHSMPFATHCLLCRQSGSTISHLVSMLGSSAS